METSITDLEKMIRAERRRDRRLELLLTLHEPMRAADPSAALAVAQRALRLAKANGDPGGLARAIVAVGSSEMELGRGASATMRFESACAPARQAGDSRTLRSALQGIGIIRTQAGQIPSALEVLWEALAVATSIDDRVGLASLHNSIGVAYVTVSDFEFALRHYHESLAIAELDSNLVTSARARANIANILMNLGDLTEARRQFELVHQQYIGMNDRVGIAMSSASLGTILSMSGDAALAEELHRGSLAEAESLGLISLSAYCSGQLGVLALTDGRASDAIEGLDSAWRASSAAGLEEQWAILRALGEAHNVAGNTAVAFELLETAIAAARQRGDRLSEANSLELLARAVEKSGDPGRALALFREGVVAREAATGSRQHAALAETKMRREIDEARRAHEAMRLEKHRVEEEMERRKRELATMALRLAENGHFLAALQRQLLELDRSIDGAARSTLRDISRQVAEKAGGAATWETFETQFEQVHNGFLARLAGAYPELTPAELKVCTLLRINMTTKEIADALSSSYRTIEHHRASIRRRVALPDGAHLATFLAAL